MAMRLRGVRMHSKSLVMMRTLAAIGAAVSFCFICSAQVVSAVPRPGIMIGHSADSSKIAAGSGTPCFSGTADCSSTDPTVTQSFYSVGDTSACTFEQTIDWGDGATSSRTFGGGADETLLATMTHTYADVPGMYTVTITGEATVGSCYALNGTNEFTLLSTSTCGAASAPESMLQPESASEISGNWAGYVVQAPKGCATPHFVSVTGRWVQPAISCRANRVVTAVGFWVGLDGYPMDTNKTVEQTGVQADCAWSQRAHRYEPEYNAWYQMAPNDPVYSQGGYKTLKPLPGTVITATVSFDSTTHEFKMMLTVSGDPKPGEVSRSCVNKFDYPCNGLSAEWIAERPSGPYGLAAFSPWNLTMGYATTTGSAVLNSIASLNPVAIDLQRGTSSPAAYACPLDGASFTVSRGPC